MLTIEAIFEFKELYRQDFGVDLTVEEATEKATLLFSALETLVVPDLTRQSTEVQHDT